MQLRGHTKYPTSTHLYPPIPTFFLLLPTGIKIIPGLFLSHLQLYLAIKTLIFSLGKKVGRGG